MIGREAVNGAVEISLPSRRLQLRRQPRRILRAQLELRAVGEQHPHRDELIDTLAVLDRTRARRVVGDHAADVGPIGRRHVGCELEGMRRQHPVQLIAHHAGLHARPAFLDVHLEDLVHVLGEVDDDRPRDCLPGEARAAAACQQWHRVFRRHRHRAPHILIVQGHDDADGRNAVRAGIGRVERPRSRIEADFTADTRAEVGLDRGRQVGFNRIDGTGG